MDQYDIEYQRLRSTLNDINSDLITTLLQALSEDE